MDNMEKTEDLKKHSRENEEHKGFQNKTEHEKTAGKGGCGCGCRTAPADEEVVEIEEEDWNY